MSVQQYGAAAVDMAKAEIKKWIKSKIKIVAIVLVVISCIFLPFFAIMGNAGNDSSSTYLNLLPGTIYGNSIQEKVWYGMRALGFSEISTAAAMGNIHYESGSFNPEAIEYGYDENNGGIGICQWTNAGRGDEGRNTQLKKYAQSKGTTWKDENAQVEFLMYEISGSGDASGYATYQLMDTTYTGQAYCCDDWINASDSASLDENKLKILTEIFCFTFERPNAEAGKNSINTRYNYALQYYNEFHGTEMQDDSNGISHFSGDTFIDSTGKTYKLYKQGSEEFKNIPYPARGYGATIGKNGCGPTSCAIIGSGLGYSDTPATLVGNGDNYSWDYQIKGYFEARGFAVEVYTSKENIISKLSNGYDIVVRSKGPASVGGWYSLTEGQAHWYTLLDYDSINGLVFVGDPIVRRWRMG